MIVNINSYDLLLGLIFLIKIGAIVDIKRGIIQVRQVPSNNIQVLPLNMVNMHQVVRKQTQHSINAIENLEKGFECVAIIEDMQSWIDPMDGD